VYGRASWAAAGPEVGVDGFSDGGRFLFPCGGSRTSLKPFDDEPMQVAGRRTFAMSELTIRPGAGVILSDGAGRILLMRRSEEGTWGIPGGGVEAQCHVA
jgi:hypothetical protein